MLGRQQGTSLVLHPVLLLLPLVLLLQLPLLLCLCRQLYGVVVVRLALAAHCLDICEAAIVVDLQQVDCLLPDLQGRHGHGTVGVDKAARVSEDHIYGSSLAQTCKQSTHGMLRKESAVLCWECCVRPQLTAWKSLV